MLVSGGIRAIEVHILMTEQAAMLVLRMDLLCRDCVPCVAHALLDVRFRERSLGEHALPPEVEQGIVERREAFGCCRWHLDDLS